MDLSNEKQPLLLGKDLGVQRAVRMFAGLGPSETEGTSVARVTKHFEHGIVLQGHPMEPTCMGTTADTAREEESLAAKILEGGKQQANGLLDLGSGVKDDGLVLGIEQTGRQRHFQCCTTSFVKNPALQACLENMKLGLRHGSLQPEQKTVIKS